MAQSSFMARMLTSYGCDPLKKAYSRERLKQIAIDVSTKPGAISVTAKFPPQPRWPFSDHSGTVDCTIVVPATATISALELNAGEVLLDSIRGREVHARLADGRIFARNCFTNLDLTMNRGTLTLSFDWWEHEQFSAQVYVGHGNAWVFLPTDAGFHLVAKVAHGTIGNDFNTLPFRRIPPPGDEDRSADQRWRLGDSRRSSRKRRH